MPPANPSPSISILTPQEPRDTWLIDELWTDFNRRHAWLIEAGEKLRKEREDLTPSLREKQSRESGGDCLRTVATREEWRPTAHLKYEVSSEGRIKSNVGREPRILTPVADSYGYLTVQCHGRRYKVHRLVCEAFHGPPPPKADAAHLDGDRTNNTAHNLAWASRKENMAHKRLHGTHQTGESHGSAKLTALQVGEARRRAKAGESHKAIARSLGVSGTQIDRIVSGTQWAGAEA